MNQDVVRFAVRKLEANVAEGVEVEWQGKRHHSGPLIIELDEEAPAEASGGVLDYAGGRARAEFHVCLKFPEFAGLLESMGVDAELTQPVRAVLRSEGEILEDHSFRLSGRCAIAPHGLFPAEESAAAVLPGH